jgi:hypothetical protein
MIPDPVLGIALGFAFWITARLLWRAIRKLKG